MKNLKLFSILFFSLLAVGCGQERVILTGESLVENTEDLAYIQENKDCYVYICGAVINPGVYQVSAGERIATVLELAGGFSYTADRSAVNLAEKVSDGLMVTIPEISEETGTESDGRINLNTADATLLMTLPGIGEAKAKLIIDYRERNGGFSSIEEVMQIDGIKDGTFQQIKDYIKV